MMQLKNVARCQCCWHGSCNNKVVHMRAPNWALLPPPSTPSNRHLTDQSAKIFIFHFRRSRTPFPPQHCEDNVWLSPGHGPPFFYVTINMIYIMYDKTHETHYRIQDDREISWRLFKPFFFRQTLSYALIEGGGWGWGGNKAASISDIKDHFYKLVAQVKLRNVRVSREDWYRV